MTDTTDHWNATASRLEQRCLPEIVPPDETAREAAEALRAAAERVNGLPRWGEVELAVADHFQSDIEDVAEAVMALIWPEGGWTKDLTPAAAAAAEVRAERARQDEKWGEQNHPDGTGPQMPVLFAAGWHLGEADMHARAAKLAAAAKASTDLRASNGAVTWTDILLEEVFEALAEDDPTKLRAELVQVAAVAQQWAEAIDRRPVR